MEPKRYTARKIKKLFREETHCGKYWGIKPKFNIFTGIVSIQMKENEKWVYNIRSGEGKRWDWDDDGCSITNDFEFKIKESKKGKLKIIKTRCYGNSLEIMK